MTPLAPVAAIPPEFRPSTSADLLAAFFSGRSSNTNAAYRADFEEFRCFIGAATVEVAAACVLGGTHGAANGLALSWRTHMLELGRAPATINRRLSALRALVALGRTLGLIAWNIDIRNLRSEAYRDTTGPKRVGVVALLAAASVQVDMRKAARDAAAIRLLHDTALRRGEVCLLDLTDVDLEAGRVMVLGKGKREKVPITLPTATRAALAAWIALRGPQAGPVFIGLDRATDKSTYRRLTGTGLWFIVRSIGHSAGVKTWPHALRHTGITTALDLAKGDLRAVQRFSRHSDVRVLRVYDDNRTDLGGKIAAMVAVE
jgi:integrase/recombinase XerC